MLWRMRLGVSLPVPYCLDFFSFFFPADRLVLNEVILDVAFHHDRITR